MSFNIISDNIISSLGFTSDENFTNICEGKCGIIDIGKKITKEPAHASLVDDERLSNAFSKVANVKKYTRAEQLCILSIKDALSKTNIDTKSVDTALIISSTKGNIDVLASDSKFSAERVHLWAMADTVANFFEIPNKPITISNACISGVLAIQRAVFMLSHSKCKNVIVTGVDIASQFVTSGFQSFMALANAPSKPFDKDRSGLSLGEAAGTIIISKEGEGIKIIDVTSANDANHISGPSRTGEGLYRAINNLKGLRLDDIDYINAHGTGTSFNDAMEVIAYERSGLNTKPINSFKGYWGHTLGAAGIIETIVSSYSLKNNILLKSQGFDEADFDCEVNIIEENKTKEIRTCLKTAAGFGGSNAALILSK